MKATSIQPHLPHSPGVYLMRDQAGFIIYIGKARDLKKRVASYFSKSASRSDASSKIQALVQVIRHVDYVTTASEREALVLERRLINKYKPTFNTMWKDDKSYPFVALTLGEDYPRIFFTRKKKRDGKTRYFGPYPSVKRVRQLLNWTWRKKLFPLRPCKLEITEGQPYPYEKVRSCLYLHTKECPAPCLAKISSAKYKTIAKRAQWFLEGNQQKLIDQWERRMKTLSQRKAYEEAADLRDRIYALRQIQEPVTYREMTESLLQTRVKESRAVQDLTKALGLKKPPECIECFDISHIQGVEKVASMVRFLHGRPDKANYRKFIIKTVTGIDDFKSMEEVVRRRYARLLREKRPLPDLILIDGGKGQLSAALKSLKKEGVKGVDVAALAKREEEVFRPGSSKPVRLNMDSEALLLLRYIRDEAHRFAITFHRKRRTKQTMKTYKTGGHRS